MVYRILVPTDFSRCSREAIVRALEIAELRNGAVILLHVVDPSGLTEEAPNAMVAIAEERERAMGEMDDLVRKVDPDRRRVVRFEVVTGKAVKAILDRALEDNVDLICMGTHGRTGMAYDYVGSVAERVVRRALVDVLIVREKRPGNGARPTVGTGL